MGFIVRLIFELNEQCVYVISICMVVWDGVIFYFISNFFNFFVLEYIYKYIVVLRLILILVFFEVVVGEVQYNMLEKMVDIRLILNLVKVKFQKFKFIIKIFF